MSEEANSAADAEAAVQTGPDQTAVTASGETSSLSPEELDAFGAELIAAIKTVSDPAIPVDVYELGLIHKVVVE